VHISDLGSIALLYGRQYQQQLSKQHMMNSFVDPLLGGGSDAGMSSTRGSFSMFHGESGDGAVMAVWGWGVAGQLGLNTFDIAEVRCSRLRRCYVLTAHCSQAKTRSP